MLIIFYFKISPRDLSLIYKDQLYVFNACTDSITQTYNSFNQSPIDRHVDIFWLFTVTNYVVISIFVNTAGHIRVIVSQDTSQKPNLLGKRQARGAVDSGATQPQKRLSRFTLHVPGAVAQPEGSQLVLIQLHWCWAQGGDPGGGSGSLGAWLVWAQVLLQGVWKTDEGKQHGAFCARRASLGCSTTSAGALRQSVASARKDHSWAELP